MLGNTYQKQAIQSTKVCADLRKAREEKCKKDKPAEQFCYATGPAIQPKKK